MRPASLFFLPRGEQEGNWTLSREAVMTAAVTCFGFQVLFLFSVPLSLFSAFHGSPLRLASRAQHIPSALRRAAAPMTEGLVAAGAVPGGPRQLCPWLWGSSAVRRAQHHHSPQLSRSLVVVLLQHDGLPAGSLSAQVSCPQEQGQRRFHSLSPSLPSVLHLQAPLCSRTSPESLLSPHSQRFPQSFPRTPAMPRVQCLSQPALGCSPLSLCSPPSLCSRASSREAAGLVCLGWACPSGRTRLPSLKDELDSQSLPHP